MPNKYVESDRPSPEEMGQLSAVEQADWVVTEYVIKTTIDSINKVRKEIHGLGCGCRGCLKSAAAEANRNLDWLDTEGSYPRYKSTLNHGGKLSLEEVPASKLEDDER